MSWFRRRPHIKDIPTQLPVKRNSFMTERIMKEKTDQYVKLTSDYKIEGKNYDKKN